MTPPSPHQLATHRFERTLPPSPGVPRFFDALPRTSDGWYQLPETTLLRPQLRISPWIWISAIGLSLSLGLTLPFVLLGQPIPDWGLLSLPAILMPLGTLMRMTFRRHGVKGTAAEYVEFREITLQPGEAGMARMALSYGDGQYHRVALVEREWLRGGKRRGHEVRRIPLTPMSYDHGVMCVVYRIPADGVHSYESLGYRHEWGLAIEGTRQGFREAFFYPIWVQHSTEDAMVTPT